MNLYYFYTIFPYFLKIFLILSIFILSYIFIKKNYKILSFKNIVFYLYLIILFVILIFPLPTNEQISFHQELLFRQNLSAFSFNVKLIPFQNFIEIFTRWVEYYELRQFLDNIILFIPMWYLIFLIFAKNFSTKKLILIWLLLAFFAELLQFLFWVYFSYFYRNIEFDDAILNFLWFLTWFGIYKIFSKIFKK